MPDFRWGILGLGSIARKFATGLRVVPNARLVAVGSRTQAKADAFGAEFNVKRCYAAYEALAADPDVDAVYVATPHPMHHDDALLCLRHGKAVLCEKPFTVNAAQAAEVIHYARQNKLFLMEAMWTRYTPIIARLRELVKDGVVGDVRMVQADFGYRADVHPEGRLFNPALGGGALLDVGIYCLSFASMLLGTPSEVTGMATLGETGVDEQSAVLLRYPHGEIAALTTAIRTSTPGEATVMGTEGRIRVHAPFWIPSAMTLSYGDKVELIALPYAGNGYGHEAEEVARCVAQGLTESAAMPLDETLALMRTMDALRAQWGLKYPME